MKRRFRKLKTNKYKEGASLISVIIGVTFLAAIGLTIMILASKYITTVYVDQNASKNFYEAEGVLAELRTGLLEYSGSVSDKAYKDIMEKYTTKKDMKTEFSKKYISGIASKLRTYTYVWNDADEKLGVAQECDINKLKVLSTVPDAIKTKSGGNLYFVINYSKADGYTLTIKNLLIEFVNSANYRSTINTDIVFRVPDYKFEGDSTFEQLKNYIVITDKALNIEGAVTAGSSTDFLGNIYTGDSDSGINVASQNNVNFYSPLIISRGSFDIFTGANVLLQGENGTGNLWLENIRLKHYGCDDSTLSTKFMMDENAYISNDLTIDDNYSEIVLKGKYYGYSYNKENEITATEKKDANYSSAILVNGTNTTINAFDLTKMILAGRSFVQQNDSGANVVQSDIMMGESVAPKSNQLAYLVPEEYITVGHNPVMVDELNDLTKNIESNLKTTLTADTCPLKKYLNQVQPYTANYHQVAGTAVAYLFLNFKDDVSTNQYFYDYYNGNVQVSDEEGNTLNNQEQLGEKAKTYLMSTNGMFTATSANLYLIAGNIVSNYESSGSIQSANYFAGQTPNAELLADGKYMAEDYAGYCLALVSGGKSNRADMSSIRLTNADKKLVSDVVIDFSKVNGNIIRSTTETGTSGEILVHNGDYTLKNNMSGLLIAKGDVTVEANFNGLILASGKVTVKGHRKLTADIVLVGNLLEYVKTDEELAKLFYALNGAVKYDATKLEECLGYQNWERNAG